MDHHQPEDLRTPPSFPGPRPTHLSLSLQVLGLQGRGRESGEDRGQMPHGVNFPVHRSSSPPSNKQCSCLARVLQTPQERCPGSSRCLGGSPEREGWCPA